MLESPHTFESEIRQAAQLLAQSRYAVALTGAGISTPSGIPDFRSADSGLWEKHNPMTVATLSAFHHRPEDFYEWVRPLVSITNDAIPNPAHTALADLEKKGILKAVITQNIDGLHTEAGSKNVYEVHGHTREVECLSCGRTEEAAPHMARLAADGSMPICVACGAVIKPKVILFGELLPAAVINGAHQASQRADVMLIAGSSLEVAPVSELPWLAHRNQARLIVINFQPTPIDHLADVIIRDDVAKILPLIVSNI